MGGWEDGDVRFDECSGGDAVVVLCDGVPGVRMLALVVQTFHVLCP